MKKKDLKEEKQQNCTFTFRTRHKYVMVHTRQTVDKVYI